MFGYVRGQILFSLIMGASAALGLWIFGVVGIFPDGQRYALFFGAFYGLMEFIPYIGPIIGPLPAILVALFNDPISAVWVTLLFIALQQFEGHFVAPQVFRISLRINPILIILSLLLGYRALRDRRLADRATDRVGDPRDRGLPAPPHRCSSRGERWTRSPRSGRSRRPAAPAVLIVGRRPDLDDAFCRSCGASLEPRVHARG